MICGDSLEEVDKLDRDSIDLVITSPPYKAADGYTNELIRGVFESVHRVLNDSGVCFINFGHLSDFKTRPYDVVDILTDIGFVLHDTIIWVKNHFTPLRGNNLNNMFEFVFMFYKKNFPIMDRLAIGVPYKCKTNVGRYAASDLRCGGNVWYIKYDTVQRSKQKAHQHGFPIELPRKCIKLFPLAETILDPFAGSGTVGVAAILEGRSFVGIEKSSQYVEVAIKQLEKTRLEC